MDKAIEKAPVQHADGCTTNLGIIGAECNCGATNQRDADHKYYTGKGYRLSPKLKLISDEDWETVSRALSRKFSFNRISWLRHPERDECLLELAKETQFQIAQLDSCNKQLRED